jgi:hypothetical protein
MIIRPGSPWRYDDETSNDEQKDGMFDSPVGNYMDETKTLCIFLKHVFFLDD